MAVFSYICKDCGLEFDIEKGINDDRKVICKCGSENVRRVYRGIGVNLSFKGSYNESR